MTQPVPHRWGYIAWGTAAVTVGAIACALVLLGASRVSQRDMVTETRAELQRMERVLRENAIPADSIEREPETIRRDGRASWAYATYTIEIPTDMNVEGVANVLRKRLRHDRITVANNASQAAPGHELVFAMENRPFAKVRVERTPEPSVAHYSQAAERAVNDVVRALNAALPTSAGEIRSIPTPRSNHEAVWAFINVQLQLTKPYDPIRAGEALAALPENIRVGRIASQSPNTTVFSVAYKDLPCGEIALIHEAGAQLPKVPSVFRIAGAALQAIPPTLVADAFAPQTRIAHAPRPLAFPGAPKMAIIVDDGGYYREATERILALDTGLTLSILPFAPLSGYIANRGAELGFEIMLHMPMASFNSIHDAPGFIAPEMESEEIVARLDAALAAVPTAIGLNNHTGSRYTANERAMETLLTAVQERSLYFIDSRTTTKSCALEVATRMGVPTIPRDLFLDNSPSIPAIRQRFNELIQMALKHGTAVGICHFRPNTAIVMEEVLPEIRAKGIEIVHVSQLLP